MAAVASSIEVAEPAQPAKPALTPPTSEEWNHKVDDSSDLSDVEEDDDIGEIEPDHYYDGGKIPVFKPTMDQFRSFKKFVNKIDKYGMKSGIVKVIPPQEWRDSLSTLDEAIKTIKVKNPITQEFSGTHGTYTQANIEKQRSYNLPQWKALTEESQHQPPAKRGERRRNQEKHMRTNAPKPRPAPRAEPNNPTEKRKPGRPRKYPLKSDTPKPEPEEEATIKDEPEEQDEPDVQVPPTPTSPENMPKDAVLPDTTPTKQSSGAKKLKSSTPKSKDSQPKSISERRKYNQKETADQIDEAAFKDFDYKFHGNDEFTPERCAELENSYWRGLTFAPPMYGADMPGSLFDESTTSWNVAKLENLLDVLGQKVPGVNTAYLYLGMWKATFAWHLEDVDLYSINYIHFGAPKQWYSISQEDARRFENAMRSVWPNDAKNCSQFLRHKTYLISPALLQSQYNIKVNKLVHNEGEFVITFPYGYHSGYNLGYNCAESVNFATESWLEFGRIAKKCECEADSVWIDVEDIERKLRGEPTPEYYEETDDDELDDLDPDSQLPSPPASVAGRSRQAGRKRKRDAGNSTPRKVKKIKIRIRSNAFEPCVLCPNDIPAEPLLSTDTGRKAHVVCALYTPETYLEEGEDGLDVIKNVANIDKARLELKCFFCRSKKGACFQCSAKKCTRSFHSTCAMAAGVQVDFGPTPEYDQDGTEYYREVYDFRCRFHRAKRPKNLSPESLENNTHLRDHARSLQPGDIVQAQFLQSDIFAGVVVENRPSERTLLIQILPNGDQVEVEWKWLLKLDPSDSMIIKPSPNAKPLPEHLLRQAIPERNFEYGPPKPDEPFCNPEALQKWAEFHTAPEPQNPLAKVDISKENQLWYYLPTLSTETKPKFTEDLARPRDNPKGNFLESVKPVPIPTPFKYRPPQLPNLSRPALNSTVPPKLYPLDQSKQTPQGIESQRPYQYKPRPDRFGPNSMVYSQFSPGLIRPNVANMTGQVPGAGQLPARLPYDYIPGRNPAVAGPDANYKPENHSPKPGIAPTATMSGGSHTNLVTSESLAHASKYPYLKNSLLRRMPYKSPYPTLGAFAPEYLPRSMVHREPPYQHHESRAQTYNNGLLSDGSAVQPNPGVFSPPHRHNLEVKQTGFDHRATSYDHFTAQLTGYAERAPNETNPTQHDLSFSYSPTAAVGN